MKTLNYEDVVNLYIEAFGEAPEITGGSLWDSGSIIERLLDAIDSGVPFVDSTVPDGALI